MSTEEVILGGKIVEKVNGKTVSEKDLAHVLAAYRGTLTSNRTSPEAKVHAEERIQELTSMEEGKVADPKHVIAGLKAALHNEHVHEDTKKEIRMRLVEMGLSEDEAASV